MAGILKCHTYSTRLRGVALIHFVPLDGQGFESVQSISSRQRAQYAQRDMHAPEAVEVLCFGALRRHFPEVEILEFAQVRGHEDAGDLLVLAKTIRHPRSMSARTHPGRPGVDEFDDARLVRKSLALIGLTELRHVVAGVDMHQVVSARTAIF